jgi:serine protease 16
VGWINQEYGEVHIAGTNIAFPSGTIDPWHALSVTNYTAPLTQATEQSVYIEGTAHCADLYAPANSDPASLTYAREVISSLVARWLA